MIATGGAMNDQRRAPSMGLREVHADLDFDALRQRIAAIEDRLESGVPHAAREPERADVAGHGRLVGPNDIEVETVEGDTVHVEADVIVLSTGSRPRIPEWAPIDGERVLTTRDAYPPPSLPEHLVVIGSGVTGVEFVHMFSAFGCEVTLIVSRQQVLPQKDPRSPPCSRTPSSSAARGSTRAPVPSGSTSVTAGPS